MRQSVSVDSAWPPTLNVSALDPRLIHAHVALLTYYCVFILLASIAGGMIPVWFQLTHRGMQFAVSFVAGVMLGVGVLHMLPHAIADADGRRRGRRQTGP